MSNTSEQVLDAIEKIVTNSVERAGYDRTIQAQILSCEDATIGKYRCRYQDAIIYAYSNNPEITYNDGTYVYISVPNNDMRKEKIIQGTTQKLGINYISQAEGDQAYDIIGTNCMTSTDKYYLNTKILDYKYSIYSAGDEQTPFNIEDLNKYIKQSSSVIVGATFKTSINPENQYRGHYGITYNLLFTDNATGQQVIRSYTVDEDNMIDNPYRLAYETRQYQIFDIDGPNFIRVESIEIFNRDFPVYERQSATGRLTSGDIEISKLELSGAARMSQNEINGVSISFYTPMGTYFTDDSLENAQKIITAQVRVKGKLVSAAQNIPFYWGIEHAGIFPSSQYYNRYLGRGWKCINESNLISSKMELIDPLFNAFITERVEEGSKNYYYQNYLVYIYDSENDVYNLMTEDDYNNKSNIDCYYSKPNVIEWVPGKDTHIFNKSAATARDNRLKVAIFYDGNVITKEINIQNFGSVPQITIESSDGTQFYYDIGHPTLTCNVDYEVENPEYKYFWCYQDSAGVTIQLPNTQELNDEYAAVVTTLNNLKTAIANGEEFANAQEQNLIDAETAVKNFNFIQRVDNDKIYDVQINKIITFGIFKCSVFNRDVYLGTTAITLTNTLEGQNLYSLVINNGSNVFQYNEDGIAPNSKSLDAPLELQALSFTIYDNLGQPLDSDAIVKDKNCKVRWSFPIGTDTMLEDNNGNEESAGTDATLTYKYYDNKVNLNYNIRKTYDISKQRNQIRLMVDYKGMNLTTETSFTFAKQGDPGTNGTQYIVKLVPNTRMNNPPLWPMITKAGDKYILNYGLNSTDEETEIGAGISNQLFKAQLWHSGELIWEGFSTQDSAKDGVSKPSLVHWEVLKNKYNTSTSDASAFNITNAGSGYIAYLGDQLASAIETPLANIIKCSITWRGQEDKTYYGTIPVTTAWTTSGDYKVGLKDNTGFRYVVYTSDGVLPKYDNSHPFEFTCMEKIDDIWEDISTVSGKHQVKYNYSDQIEGPIAVGNYLSMEKDEPIPTNLLEILKSQAYRDGCEKNQWRARPASKYDGECVNVAICCIYRQGDNVIGRINVPIHYLLNRYGMAHLNDWDGNSVQVNSQGGYILSPQMGAGSKDSSNNFTGVLMGEVKTTGKNESDIGLLGYANGARTFFLNSKDGSATFGKNNNGQIIIDPNDGAKIYGGNYSTQEKSGMLIDLSKPIIQYGSGNFVVDENGHLTAKGGGQIAGWKIQEKTLQSDSGSITLDSAGKIYSNSHDTLTSTDNGFYLAADGLSIGSRFKVAYDNNGKAILYLGGYATANGGTDNKKNTYWTINGDNSRSYISYGGNVKWQGANSTTEKNPPAKVYLGTDGISLGTKFSVSPKGELSAYNGIIGGWKIGTDRLQSTNTYTPYTTKEKLPAVSRLILHSDGSISGGSKSYSEYKNKNNKTRYKETADNTWEIKNNGAATFNNLTANGTGQIGGWTIGSKSLKGGNLTLNSDGSMSAVDDTGKTTWQITKDGKATFNTTFTLTNNFSLTGTGTIGDGGSFGNSNFKMTPTGGVINPPSVNLPDGGVTLSKYIQDLAVGALTVNTSFNLFKKDVDWRQITYISNIQSVANGWLAVQYRKHYVLGTTDSSIAPAERIHVYG